MAVDVSYHVPYWRHVSSFLLLYYCFSIMGSTTAKPILMKFLPFIDHSSLTSDLFDVKILIPYQQSTQKFKPPIFFKYNRWPLNEVSSPLQHQTEIWILIAYTTTVTWLFQWHVINGVCKLKFCIITTLQSQKS